MKSSGWLFVACALCIAGAAAGQSIDVNLLSKEKIQANCELNTYVGAEDCVGRLIPTLNYRAAYYAADNATYIVRVTYDALNNPAARPSSFGSGFLVDRDRGFVITAKHVLVGNRDWTSLLQSTTNQFANLDTAIEDTLSRTARIELQTSDGMYPMPTRLVAIDRDSDLALLQITNLNAIQLSNFKALFQAIPLVPEGKGCSDLKVIAIGFQEAGAGVMERRRPDEFTKAECLLQAGTYYIGMLKHRIPLLTTGLKFTAGNSGGPVLNEQFQVVGVVSGAKTNLGDSINNYFVPVSAVRSFLNRFR
ncbi:trypsin-like peptidase domain-containing protein [Ramlibacter sp. USB13]|uniref:Trypsin-like peptidase domain-containing protein n=1 Tax=Ramlibacter cellulosilyticus TaxID=2764187 RepID=A0A923MP04_9BURK|nr:serine protease [Ramlibacter cellulosilyticus]MBC5782618.1 trypsin-like peptidase domain-containing protein [Ramlibacter cellulosilyticus]